MAVKAFLFLDSMRFWSGIGMYKILYNKVTGIPILHLGYR